MPGTPSQEAVDRLEQRFPAQAGGRAVAVFATTNGRVDDPANQAAIAETLSRVAALDHVRQVIEPFGPAAGLLQSPDGTVAYAQIIYDVGARSVPKDQVEALFDTAAPARERPHSGPWLQRVLAQPAVQRVMVSEGLAPPFV